MYDIRRRWQVFSAAPHRMFFASGLIWLLAWSGWWTMLLVARASGLAGLEPARPALLLHGAMMLFLALPPFMYGFLLTVFPRWMPAAQPRRVALLAALVLLNAGNLAFLAGLAGPVRLLTVGWLLAAGALAVIALSLLEILLRARTRVSHAYVVLAGLAAGGLGMALLAPAFRTGDFAAWPLVRGVGLWGFLLVVYFGVCHRMIPFFSSRVVPGYVQWRPDWVLYLFTGLAFARAWLELAPALAWLASVPLAAVATVAVLLWRPRQRSSARLLDVLHISVAWLAAGLLLAALADVALVAGAPGLVGRAPLHALGMGFLGGMLMAMVTRVTLGHSGRPLALDPLNWRLFLVIQAAAVLRVLAEFLPAVSGTLSMMAAMAWFAAFAAWGMRQLLIYLRPRVDGAPG
jgi:uncharacterized protein involved in response to NO